MDEKLFLGGSPIDTGVKTFALKNDATVSFNPTDPTLLTRIHRATVLLDNKQTEYKAKQQEMAKSQDVGAEVLDFLDALDADMRAIMNAIFIQDIPPEAFDYVGMYAYNTAGVPIWIAFLTAVMDTMDVSVKTAQREESDKVKKLLDKYRKK